ncbi:MAG: threonine/serine dehydratase [Syntrophorhabdales bacterium]|jgi:threonine dehydratase
MITVQDIESARERIARHIHRTPLLYSRSLSEMSGAEVYIKAENLQKTGSFKVRGAFNKLSTLGSGRVIAASRGNHAQAVAFAAESLGLRARIVMPVGVPIVKEEATKGYGAEVELYGENLQQALDHALSQQGFTFIHPYDDDEIIAGQGTVGLEVLESLDKVDCLVVPVGGGGLLAGIARAVKETSLATQVIGVQTESATSAFFSFKEKKVSQRTALPTLADGIAVGRVGEKPFEIITKYVDDMLLVSEDPIAMAILLFLERTKFVVEGAGAVPLAALLKYAERFRGKRVVLIASGGNVDLNLIEPMQTSASPSECISVCRSKLLDAPKRRMGLPFCCLLRQPYDSEIKKP